MPGRGVIRPESQIIMRTSYVKLLLGSLLLGATLSGCEQIHEQQAPIEAQTPTCSLAEYRTAGATNEPFSLSFAFSADLKFE